MVTMNPKYDPDADDTYVFSAKVPGGVTTRGFWTEDFLSSRKSKKAETVGSVMKVLDKKARPRWVRDMKSSDKRTRAMATMLELTYQTGARIGAPGNATDGQSTYGVSTLLTKHITETGTGFRLRFLGKSGVPADYRIDAISPELKVMVQNIYDLLKGKGVDDHIFTAGKDPITGSQINAYFKKLTGIQSATIHKIRHARGTALMLKLMEEDPAPKSMSQSEADKYIKEKATKVGQFLSHVRGVGSSSVATSSTALKSYIDADTLGAWYEARELRIPEFLRGGAR